MMSDRSRKLFEVLVRENEGALVAWLRTMVRDPGLVDDLFQETLITAWRKFDDFDHSRPLGPWLRGIALNLARNAGRKRQRDCLIFSDRVAEQVEAGVRAIEVSVGDSWQEKRAALTACLDRLTPRSRELVRDRYERGCNASSIAAERTTTSATIRKQLQRIRETLSQCIDQQIAGVVS